MTILQATPEADQIDEAFMHIYQTMHSLFYVDLENTTQYTSEELSIEGV